MNKNDYRDILPEGYHLHWYELLSVLGRGGYGITYLAMDTNLDRKVAIKEYLPLDFASRSSDGTVQPMSGKQGENYQWGLKRFVKEARTLAKFKHPNIVPVLSVFEFNKTAYMVMKYEQGLALSDILSQNQETHSEQALLDIFLPVLDGLALAHKEGFTHRDIKPANILIREDKSPVLLDFGSARQTLGGKTKPLTSLVTAGFAPFEQYHESAGEQGPWTDIYGIAACLYTAICGKCPANALDRASSIINKGKDCYEPISTLAANDYSRNFLLAIDYGLRFESEERPQDAPKWADMLSGKLDAPDYIPSVKVDTDLLADDDKTVVMPAVHVKASAQETADVEIKNVLKNAPVIDEDKTVAMPASQVAQQMPPKPKIDISLPPTEPFSPKLAAANSKPPPPVAPPQTPLPPQQPVEPIRENVYRYETVSDDRLEKVKKSSWILGPVALVAASVVFVVFLFIIRVEVPDKPAGVDREKIASLLAKAEQQMAENKLLEPEGEAAVYRYLEVLELDAGNLEAQKGLNNIKQYLQNNISQNIVENQLIKAEANLIALEAIAPTSADTFTLRQKLNTARHRDEQFPTLLAQAQQAFKEKKYLHPADNNAYQLYTKVLNIDPNNREAKQAMEQMSDYYEARAKHLINADKIQEAKQTISSLEILSAKKAAALRLQIEDRTPDINTKLAAILKQGDHALRTGRLTKPARKNALHYYQQVLNMDAQNGRALDGIQAVHSQLDSIFNEQLKNDQLDQAGKTLHTIKAVAPGTKLAKRAEQKYLSLVQASKPEVEIISDMVSRFKKTLESQDLQKIRKLSEYQEGRHQFVQQFINNYQSFKVNVSGFQYIAEDHKAIVKVNLSHLINKNGHVVQPGPWGDFEIEISKNEQAQWKVRW